jgi:hypothetical protein
MTARTHTPAAIELHNPSRLDHGPVDCLSLRASEDGWSLIAHDGVVVFRGFGLASRRECLQYAHDIGVLTVLG